MSSVLVDTSVLIKWFHEEGEQEVAAARALRDAHAAGALDAYVLDLAVYEVGNVLARALGWAGQRIHDQLLDLLAIVGPPVSMDPSWLRTAAAISEQHHMSFYDASWAACGQELGIPLVSADRRLIASGLALDPTAAERRLLS